jgi:hypothetical protein
MIMEPSRAWLFHVGWIGVARNGDAQSVNPTLPNFADERVAGAIGKHDVRDDGVEALFAQKIDSGFQISCCGNGVTAPG